VALWGIFVDAILEVRFWRITHFEAWMSTISQCAFVNIINRLFIKKVATLSHAQEILKALKYSIHLPLMWTQVFLEK